MGTTALWMIVGAGMKPAQLPEDVGMYVDALRKQCPAIDQVWVLGPRVNAPEHRGADWDLLVFADAGVLDEVRSHRRWHRDDVTLFVVVDGDRFEKAWGDRSTGTLSGIGWRLEDPQSATYEGLPGERAAGGPARGGRFSAVRVR